MRKIVFFVLLASFSSCTAIKNFLDPLPKEYKILKLESVDTLVDIGCQNGFVTKKMAHFYPTMQFILEDFEKYTYVDKKGNEIIFDRKLQLNSLLKSSMLCPKLSTRYQFVAGKEDSIPLATAAFKRILCRKTVHEFTQKQKMCDELGRILKEGGILSIVEREPMYENQVDTQCKHTYLTKEQILQLFSKLKLINITSIKHPKGNMIVYDFTK